MQFNEAKLNAAINEAKAKAAGNRALLNAIEKAARGLGGAWIVTELHDGLMVTLRAARLTRSMAFALAAPT